MSNKQVQKHYIIDGAVCQCTLGSSPGILRVNSQTKVRIQGKLKATHKDKLISPTFGTCKKKTPCLPKLQDWQNTSIKTTIGNSKKFILNDSFAMCAVGGKVTISNHGQVHNPVSTDLSKDNDVSSGGPENREIPSPISVA